MNNSQGYPARFYQVEEGKEVRCLLCPHNCQLTPGALGRCRTRKNIAGKLNSLNYGEVSSISLDPIEKKPLYHFHPEARTLSVGTWGCNLSCGFCQNWRISQDSPQVRELSPQEVVELCQNRGVEILAFTYSEPLIWYEFVSETAELAQAEKIATVLVSNGFVNPEPLAELIPKISACNIDLKSFRDEFYRKFCQGELAPVKKNLEYIAASSTHLEVTNLLISGKNTSQSEIEELVKFLADLEPEIPLHISRYHPAYKFKEPATDIEDLLRAYALAKEHLSYVYLGNVPGNDKSNTSCPNCGSQVIIREGFSAHNYLQKNRCPECRHVIAGIFN